MKNNKTIYIVTEVYNYDNEFDMSIFTEVYDDLDDAIKNINESVKVIFENREGEDVETGYGHTSYEEYLGDEFEGRISINAYDLKYQAKIVEKEI